MPKPKVSVLEGRPLLDIASYARRGPTPHARLSPAEVSQIARTVDRVPEAVVKVLPRGSAEFHSLGAHIGYVGRYGKLELETDDGERLQGKGVGSQLLEDWDLDLDEHRRHSSLAAVEGRRPPKLVHKLMFSMPAGIPSKAVLSAARNFLREEFGPQHRYAFVLHTDEPHPHVHAIVKAVSEQGIRLHIKKTTLREWRSEFARHLRDHGVAANATERAVRGQRSGHKIDAIYRSMRDPKRYSTFMRARAGSVAEELRKGDVKVEAGKRNLVETRQDVERGWNAVRDILIAEARPDIAVKINRFLGQMQAPRTERELITERLSRYVDAQRADPRTRELRAR